MSTETNSTATFVPDSNAGHDENVNVTTTKRANDKDESSPEIDCRSPTARDCINVRPKRICFNREAHFQEPGKWIGLSPITELATNLSGASISTTPRLTVTTAHDKNTPLRGWQMKCDGTRHASATSMQKSLKADPVKSKIAKEIIVNESNEKKCLKTYQLSSHGSGSVRSSRRLNMNAMSVDDELSFYDDEEQSTTAYTQDEGPFSASPPLMDLLLPEGPAQRFQIVERAVVRKSTATSSSSSSSALSSSSRHNQPTPQRQRKLQQHVLDVVTHTSGNEGNTKNLRFQSLSSDSMESSMDDEYMELFEMEPLEQIDCGAMFNFPSDLNSLIQGQIKHASPLNTSINISSNSNSSVNVSLSGSKSNGNGNNNSTPEVRHSSVRRCLSMSVQQQQQQQQHHHHHQQQQQPPKTPEFLKQLQTAETSTTPFSSRLLSRDRNRQAQQQQQPHQHSSHHQNGAFKRPDPPSTVNSPVQSKRYRGDEKENMEMMPSLPVSRPPLRKCMSMNDAEIMSALARSESKDDLIGDFTKKFALPLMEGRHRDLKSISSDTVASLIRGEFNDIVENFSIIDCRYPYEFEGGHIRGAKNLYTQEQIIEEFLTQQKTEQHQLRSEAAGQKRNIIIFHCEFSSERGPKLSRFLRNTDRAKNTTLYPTLDYPEIYLLHNGYKEFYETHSELCVPVSYRPMLEPAYSEAYRHFRAKSKSWNGDGSSLGGGGGTSRLKKTRSRLLL